jgi:hypothetical protein
MQRGIIRLSPSAEISMPSKPQPQQQVQAQSQPEQEFQGPSWIKNTFGEEPEKPIEGNQILDTVKHLVGMPVGRTLEQAAGGWGSLLGIIPDIMSASYPKPKTGAETFGPGFYSYSQLREKYPLLPPSAQDYRKVFSKATKGKFEPNNAIERFADSAYNTAAAIGTNPVGMFSKGPTLGKALLAGIGGEGAREGAKYLGLSKGWQDLAHIGATFVITMPNVFEKILNVKDVAFKGLDATLKENGDPRIKADIIRKGLSSSDEGMDLSNYIKTGLNEKNSVVKREIAPIYRETLGKIDKNETVSINELWSIKKQINENIGSNFIKGGPVNQRLKYINKVVDDALKSYEEINPTWGELYPFANKLHKDIIDSGKLSSVIEGSAGLAEKAFKHVGLGWLFKGGKAMGLSPKDTFGAIGLMSKNPHAFKEYSKAILATSQNSIKAAGVALDNLNKIYEKEVAPPVKERGIIRL